MARWLGIVVSGDRLTAVDAEVPDAGSIAIISDFSWSLQQGGRAEAYVVMHARIQNYLKENDIRRVIVKESALSMGSTKKSHLLAAELRGVVLAASASIVKTNVLARARISKNFGERKVDEYLKDEDFWDKQTSGKQLRAGSREAAMILLFARKTK